MSVTESCPSAAVLTQGCKVNQYESEAIAEALTARGFTIRPPQEVCDLYVVNTCTVTAESDRKARQAIRRLLSENPEAFLIGAEGGGCHRCHSRRGLHRRKPEQAGGCGCGGQPVARRGETGASAP